MTASKLSTRLLTLALAAGPVACHQSPASAQEKDAPQPVQTLPPPGQPPVTPEPPKPPDRPDGRKATTVRPGAYGGGGGGGGFKPSRGEPFTILAQNAARFTAAGEANTAVVGTSPMTREVQDESREDLNVMDRLLRQSVSDPDGDGPMGLKMILGSSARLSPIYVEGAGVILSATVPWPLAPSAEKDSAGEGQRERPSRWAQVRREVRGEPMPDGQDRRRMPFDAARIDALTNSILTVLPEAANFRHLKPTESVFVTISGISEDGAAMRITFKASKADIDEASKGTIDAEAFKQRVSKRIG